MKITIEVPDHIAKELNERFGEPMSPIKVSISRMIKNVRSEPFDPNTPRPAPKSISEEGVSLELDFEREL